MKRMISILALLVIVENGISAIQFKQVWFSDIGYFNTLSAGDMDHDNKSELYLYATSSTPYQKIFEETFNNNYALASSVNDPNRILTVGNIDNDSLSDAIGNVVYNFYDMGVFESSKYDTFPLTLKWATADSPQIINSYITDLDQDGKKEILCRAGKDYKTRIYECTGDNNYQLVYNGYPDLPESTGALGGIAYGDYDNDGLMEIVMGTSDGVFPHYWSAVYVMENTAVGVDSYATVWKDSVLTFGAYNACTGEDMDGNGKNEFLIMGRHNPGNGLWDVVVTIFEAIDIDTYAHIWSQTFQTNLGLLVGQCDIKTGDVDKDGKLELVIATPESLFVYKAFGASNYQRIFNMRTGPDYANRLKDGVLLVYDMNKNGYDEIIISGACDAGWTIFETRFYEIMGEVVFDSLKATTRDTGITVEWWTGTQFANYGFELYKHEPGMADTAYYLVYQALDSVQYDTTHRYFSFHDIDVMTDSTYKYQVRALTLNNDSDYHGPVTALGVGGRPFHGRSLPFALCQNAPNPFRGATAVRYQLPSSGMVELAVYNATGQLVKMLARGVRTAGGHSAVWDGKDDRGRPAASGVYFCRLAAGGSSGVRKMIVLR